MKIKKDFLHQLINKVQSSKLRNITYISEVKLRECIGSDRTALEETFSLSKRT